MPLVPTPPGVPPADAACQAFARHPVDACADAPAPRDALLRALEDDSAILRDAKLSCLEDKPSFAPGLVRALRAELAPTACADVLTLPYLEPRRPELDRRLEDTLIALAAAGKLARLVEHAPELAPPFDKPHFNEFFQGTLKPWIVQQAQAIHELSVAGPRLSPYAKGVIAIEAGLADMRFVAVVRKVALPKEMNDDPEVRNAYYAALDEALEPRKARGRDAALVGLTAMASEGVLFDPRVERARALLSEVYAGRRINALDSLLVPELGDTKESLPELALAARLPTFYAGWLFEAESPTAPLLRALLSRGLPKPLEARLEPGKLDDESRDLLIFARLARGRIYFRADDFAATARLSSVEKPTPARRFYHALGSALAQGPRDASALLLGGPVLPAGTAPIAELDALAKDKANPFAAFAAFDAAYLLGLVPPQNEPKFWDDLGARFELARRSLHAPKQVARARELAAAARDTAKALRASSPAPGPAAK